MRLFSDATPPASPAAPAVTPGPRVYLLKVADRCDRCGAQAYVLATVLLPEGSSDLLFCAHHFRKHEAAIREVAVRVVDETGRLLELPPPAL